MRRRQIQSSRVGRRKKIKSDASSRVYLSFRSEGEEKRHGMR